MAEEIYYTYEQYLRKFYPNRCPKCEGKGEIEDYSDLFNPQKRLCPKCFGTGKRNTK